MSHSIEAADVTEAIAVSRSEKPAPIGNGFTQNGNGSAIFRCWQFATKFGYVNRRAGLLEAGNCKYLQARTLASRRFVLG